MNGMSSRLPLRHTLPHRSRLKKKREFQAVYEHGRRVGGRTMTIWALPDPHGTRVGFVASRRVGGAVERNRAKRLLREAFRLHRPALVGSYHIVLVARSECPRASRDQVEAELVEHLRRAGCLGGAAAGARAARRGRGRRGRGGHRTGRGPDAARGPRRGEDR